MDQKGQTDLLIVLVGGLFGAATGALMSLWVNVWAASHRRSKLNKELRFEPRERSGHRVAARVHNGYKFPLSHVYAYITIKHDLSDVLDHPPGYEAYIKPGDHKFEEDRLCWSAAGNPPYVDIYAGEKQSLDVLEIGPSDNWIQIPSENGWGVDGRTSRVFLKMKKYDDVTIKIVSLDIEAKEFPLQIDPFNKTMPLSLR